MKPIDFLRKELNVIADQFPEVHIKYGFNASIDTHIVELLPLEEYNNNEELDAAWMPLSTKFMETFENDDIAFISSDSSLKIANVLLEFNENYNSSLSTYFSQLQANYPLGTPIYGNGIFIPDYDLFNGNNPFNGIAELPAILKYHNHHHDIKDIMSTGLFVNPINNVLLTIEIATAGNTSYAMAA